MAKKSLLFLLFTSLTFASAQAVAPSYKIAFIDSTRILREYNEAQSLLKELAKQEADLNKKILHKRQEIQKAKEAKKTDTEIQMMAEKIRLELEPEAKKIEEESTVKSKAIEDKVDEVIKNYSTKSKYDLVVVKEAILYGGTDITDEILKLLNK